MTDLQRYANRATAGRELARHLSGYKDRSHVLVLGLPRGGVPVAAAVAAALGAPLDVFLVRKLGVPGHPEFAFGAIAEGGVKVLSAETMRQLDIPARAAEEVAVRERLELDRRGHLYRGDRPAPSVRDRVVIVIDDGLATGATMEAAVMALRQLGPARVIVAAPVGARDTCLRLRRVADEVVCPHTPEPFSAVGLWYEDFSQTTDDEVKAALAAAGRLPLARAEAGRAPATLRSSTVDLIRRRATRLTGDPDEYDGLLELVGDARVVLIGEASHGTHEFYRERALMTRRLIAEKGFSAVAVEADWPDAYRVNRFVRGVGTDEEAIDALTDFRRFPTWMWRNADVLDFVGWLRTYNDGRAPDARAGFYGLDLYSLQASMDAVLAYLRKVDPEGASRARARYACFDRFGGEWDSYAYASNVGLTPSCEREVLGQLIELRRQAADYARRDGRIAQDEYFAAEQNARLVRNAEEYYRTMLGNRVESWNLRDRHMAATLTELMTFLKTSGRPPRIVVWAHNSHLGDARATEMGESGELNVGQLVRESVGHDAVLVGFTTDTGTVTAADEWDGPAHRKHVRPALAGSHERLLHECGESRLLLPLRTDLELAAVLSPRRLERAIGVIYRPDTERRSHYFHARLADQFDVVVHIDETRAVEPLERTATWTRGEVADTYPSGL